MSALKNIAGQRFSRLVVLERAENNKSGEACWHCKCDCGRECIVRGADLRNGNTKSCGCLAQESRKQTHKTHGKSHSKIYRTWQNIRRRCSNPNFKGYENYGGRGIILYPAWVTDFKAFYEYVSQLEHFDEPGRSLDRVDNNSGYFPGNLRWATKKEQARNRRNNHLVEYNGEKMTVAEAAEKSGIAHNVLFQRIHNGWAAEKLFQPVKK